MRTESNVPYKLIHTRNKKGIDICTTNDDIKMPFMNGHEAVQEIKSKKPVLPIITQTAYSTHRNRKMAINYGCDDFITKLIDKKHLFELIDKNTKKLA